MGQAVKRFLRKAITKRYQLLADATVSAAALMLAYWIRFEFHPPAREIEACLHLVPWVVALQLLTLAGAGAYKQIWRFLCLADLGAFVVSCLLSFGVLISARIVLSPEYVIGSTPQSVIGIDAILAYTGLVGVRALRRIYFERVEQGCGERRNKKAPVLMIGAGLSGLSAAVEIRRTASSTMEIKGFVDDDPNKARAVINGFRVLGAIDDIPALVREYDIDHVVLSLDSATRPEVRRILDLCDKIRVRVQIIPSLHEIFEGRTSISRFRDLRIEDLLGREPIQLEEEDIRRFITGKRVMVTGAGGSIGSELARQCAHHAPEKLLLVERCEYMLFRIQRELLAAGVDVELVPLLLDACNASRVRAALAQYRPDVVIHAAAHKHVPMTERNVGEAVMNNAYSTYVMGHVAGESGVSTFVLISTDKAVRPTSVLGATKRVAELVIQSLSRIYRTRYVAVRFGNVIGSTGSVIPIFQEQIQNGGPVTVTHPDMTRYFMTIPEATQLVLQAASIGRDGEILVLDMGEPVRILDLAHDMIRLAGLRPLDDIEIVFTGIRPGEKLTEAVFDPEERLDRTRYQKILSGGIGQGTHGDLLPALERLAMLYEDGDDVAMKAELMAIVPEARFGPASSGERLKAQAAAS
jgi:FlaA1/EpsC-like NDP-sugar epimerase